MFFVNESIALESLDVCNDWHVIKIIRMTMEFIVSLIFWNLRRY